MIERTGAQELVSALIAHGARSLFGIPGVHTLPLYDALADHPQLVPIVTRHEAGATFAADGYARVSGQPGVVSVVPGPGALNASTGVLCAWSDRVPMIVLSAELDPTDRRGTVHEGDLEAIYKPFTKTQLRISTYEDIACVVDEAFAHALRAPKGPVQVLIPLHVLKERGSIQQVAAPHTVNSSIDNAILTKLISFLQSLQAPTLMLGMGVTGSSKQAATLVERLGVPVFTDVAARGIIPEDHPFAAGLLSWSSAPAILASSDGMLVLGSRLSEITTLNWDVRLPSKLARVDADASELQGNYAATLAVQADPALVLQQLLDMLPMTPTDTPSLAVRALTTVRNQRDVVLPESQSGRIHPHAAIQELRAALPRDAIITTDGTATEFWLSEPSFPILSPAGFLVPEIQQTMGYSLAAAVGAAVGLSETGSLRPIVCVTGDGSLQMLPGELATAASLARQFTVVIFEDGYYNALRIYQDGLYGRQVGVTLSNPDFALLGRAYGADVTRVEDICDLRRAVEQSLATAKLSIIAVAIDSMPLPDRYARRLQQMTPPEPPV